MMSSQSSSSHATEGSVFASQQTTQTSRNTPGVADLFGLSLVLLLMILVGRQLAIHFYQRYQFHQLIVLLQRRATLEHQLHCKSSAPAFKKPPSQRT